MIVLTIICVLLLSVICAFFAWRHVEVFARRNYGNAFWLKTVASACFVALAFVCIGWCDNVYWKAITPIGLLLGLAGDVLLAADRCKHRRKTNYFLYGGIAFALEHYLYLMLTVCEKGATILFGLVFLIAGGIAELRLGKKYRVTLEKAGVPIVCYFVLLLLLLGTAFGTVILHFSFAALLFFVASALFVISDTFLLLHNFGDLWESRYNSLVCGAYYAAQLLYALTLLAR